MEFPVKARPIYQALCGAHGTLHRRCGPRNSFLQPAFGQSVNKRGRGPARLFSESDAIASKIHGQIGWHVWGTSIGGDISCCLFCGLLDHIMVRVVGKYTQRAQRRLYVLRPRLLPCCLFIYLNVLHVDSLPKCAVRLWIFIFR
jgi:hypothetical protein